MATKISHAESMAVDAFVRFIRSTEGRAFITTEHGFVALTRDLRPTVAEIPDRFVIEHSIIFKKPFRYGEHIYASNGRIFLQLDNNDPFTEESNDVQAEDAKLWATRLRKVANWNVFDIIHFEGGFDTVVVDGKHIRETDAVKLMQNLEAVEVAIGLGSHELIFFRFTGGRGACLTTKPKTK